MARTENPSVTIDLSEEEDGYFYISDASASVTQMTIKWSDLDGTDAEICMLGKDYIDPSNDGFKDWIEFDGLCEIMTSADGMITFKHNDWDFTVAGLKITKNSVTTGELKIWVVEK